MLESKQRIDTIVLDKTGAITAGRMTLIGVETIDAVPEMDAEAILRWAGALESAAEYPIGRATLRRPRPMTQHSRRCWASAT